MRQARRWALRSGWCRASAELLSGVVPWDSHTLTQNSQARSSTLSVAALTPDAASALVRSAERKSALGAARKCMRASDPALAIPRTRSRVTRRSASASWLERRCATGRRASGEVGVSGARPPARSAGSTSAAMRGAAMGRHPHEASRRSHEAPADWSDGRLRSRRALGPGGGWSPGWAPGSMPSRRAASRRGTRAAPDASA